MLVALVRVVRKEPLRRREVHARHDGKHTSNQPILALAVVGRELLRAFCRSVETDMKCKILQQRGAACVAQRYELGSAKQYPVDRCSNRGPDSRCLALLAVTSGSPHYKRERAARVDMADVVAAFFYHYSAAPEDAYNRRVVVRAVQLGLQLVAAARDTAFHASKMGATYGTVALKGDERLLGHLQLDSSALA